MFLGGWVGGRGMAGKTNGDRGGQRADTGAGRGGERAGVGKGASVGIPEQAASSASTGNQGEMSSCCCVTLTVFSAAAARVPTGLIAASCSVVCRSAASTSVARSSSTLIVFRNLARSEGRPIVLST